MAEKKEKEKANGQQLDPDARFKYVGFEVQPGKIGDLFKSDSEKDKWVERVKEKRKGGSRLRESNSFDEPRVAGYEKIVLAITSIMLIVSLFLPWFSGYSEHEVEAKATMEMESPAALMDSSMVDSLLDSTAIAATEMAAEDVTTPTETVLGEEEPVPGVEMADEEPVASEEMTATPPEKDEHGFASITGARKRVEIRKEHQSASAIAGLGYLGEVFSSGVILKLTGLLYLIYMLLCVASALYTLYLIFGVKGDADTVALKLKKALKLNWIPVAIWFFCMVIAFFGASYSFSVGDGGLKQLGDSYGIGVYLGLLGYGFYISLACFIMNAVKAIEI